MSQKKEIVTIIPQENLTEMIFLIRGHRVMIDRDLAGLYQVETKALNQAVKRNPSRFPADFMFQLNKTEKNELVTNCDRFKSLKHATSEPYAFTQDGVSMLSSVLNSERAVNVNINIIRAFNRMRNMISTHLELQKQIDKIESKLLNVDEEIQTIFNVIKELISVPKRSKKEIGFHTRMK